MTCQNQRVSRPAPESYDQVWACLMTALRQCADAHVAQQEVLPPMIDFLALTGLAMGGEPAVRAAIARLETWIDDWRAGRCAGFGVSNPGCHPGSG